MHKTLQLGQTCHNLIALPPKKQNMTTLLWLLILNINLSELSIHNFEFEPKFECIPLFPLITLASISSAYLYGCLLNLNVAP